MYHCTRGLTNCEEINHADDCDKAPVSLRIWNLTMLLPREVEGYAVLRAFHFQRQNLKPNLRLTGDLHLLSKAHSGTGFTAAIEASQEKT